MKKPPEKILIIATFTGIGDFFLALPMLATLSKTLGVKLDVMFRKKARFLAFAGRTGLFNQIFIYDKDGKHRNFASQARIIMDLRKRNYDMAFSLHPGRRYVLLSWLINAKIRVSGAENEFFHSLLTHSIPDKEFDREFFDRFHSDQVHGLDCFFYFLDRIGLRYERAKPDLFIEKEIIDQAAVLTGSSGKPLIGINPGSSGELKNWPMHRFSELCRKIKETHQDIGFIFFGGPQEVEKFKPLCQEFPEHTCAMGEKFNLVMNTELLKNCDLLISNDTGIVHVASFFNVPVISIGGARDGKAFLAWSDHSKNLLEPVSCDHNCCRCSHYNCVQKISVDNVFKAFYEMARELPD